MRSTTGRRPCFWIAASIAALCATAGTPLLSQQTTPDERRSRQASSARQAARSLLHAPFAACGKKWARKASKLSPEQLAWMLRLHDATYEVSLGGEPLLTMELSSSASFRHCDPEGSWRSRQTTIRVTYHYPDGTTKRQLHHFADDRLFVNREPKFFPAEGRVLLSGVDAEGVLLSRWLRLEPLEELYAEQASLRARRQTRLAAMSTP